MSSEASGATLIFPTGIDIYSTKTDRGVIVSGESHTVPVSAPYLYQLAHTPLLTSPSSVVIPGFTEISGTGTPGPNQFNVTYSGNDAGRITHSSFNAGGAASVSYTTNGDNIVAEWFNSLQTSITGIQTFIIDGLGITGLFIPITGGNVTGNLTLNGGSILTATSGTNVIGEPSVPFSTISSNVFAGNKFESLNGANKVEFTASVLITGSSHATIQSSEIILNGIDTTTIISQNSGVHITAADGVEIAGHTFPTGSFVYDLGTSTKRWRNIYADNIYTTNGGFVRKTGDDMSGDLVMGSGAGIFTNMLTSQSGTLSVSSPSGNMSLSTNGDITLAGDNILLGSTMTVNAFGITQSKNQVPNISGSIDLGTALSPYGTVYADNIVGLNLSGNFVKKSGDEMTGDLTMVGASINTNTINSALPTGTLNVNVSEFNVNASSNITFDVGPTGTNKLTIGLTALTMSDDLLLSASGLYDVGELSRPLRTIYASNLNIGNIGSGVLIDGATFEDATVTGGLVMASGSSFISLQSGTVNLGSTGSYFGTIYANTIVTAEGTGTFLSKFGDTMVGVLNIGTGSNITFDGSGVNNMGTAALPLGTLYADQIISNGLDGQYVKKTGDSMSGPLTLSNIASTGSLSISGVTNIWMSGNQIFHDAEQLNYTSHTGPIILDANSELQLLAAGSASLVVNTTGTESFKNIFPDVSGTHSLGTPQRPWQALYVEDVFVVGLSGTGNFVLKAGDSMFGDLNFTSGIGINLLSSGTSDIGSIASPLNAIYADNLSGPAAGAFVLKTGDIMTGDLYGSSSSTNWTIGTSVSDQNLTLSASSGLNVSVSKQVSFSHSGEFSISNSDGFDYTGGGDFTVSNGISDTTFTSSSFDATTGGSQFHSQNNDLYLKGVSGEYLIVKSGEIKLALGGSGNTNFIANNTENEFHKNILPSGSGSISIGTQSIPFDNLYVQNINGMTGTHSIYNEVPPEAADGVNTVFTISTTPVSGTQRVYRAGLRMTPGGVDYNFSGSTFIFVTAPSSGDNILIDYEYPAY